MKRVLTYMAAVAITTLVSCNLQREKLVNPVEFPNIDLPSYIYDQTQAQEYMAKRFWDKFYNLDIKTTDKSAVGGVDSVSFEMAFATYAQLLNLVGEGSMNNSIGSLFKNMDSIALVGDKKPLLRVMELSEKYFYNPNSPLLNEEIYLCAVNEIMGLESLSDLDKMQYEYQQKICSLNRVGTPAADFQFRQLVSGKDNLRNGSLYKINGEYTLLFFNNPDCNSCAEILEAIKNSPLQQMVDRGDLKILAMYIDEDLTAWRENRAKYPKNWLYAYDHNLILRDNELYGLRAIPSLYLLDKEKRVILKDAPVERIISYFSVK